MENPIRKLLRWTFKKELEELNSIIEGQRKKIDFLDEDSEFYTRQLSKIVTLMREAKDLIDEAHKYVKESREERIIVKEDK